MSFEVLHYNTDYISGAKNSNSKLNKKSTQSTPSPSTTLLIRIDKEVCRIIIRYGRLYVNSMFSRCDFASLSFVA